VVGFVIDDLWEGGRRSSLPSLIEVSVKNRTGSLGSSSTGAGGYALVTFIQRFELTESDRGSSGHQWKRLVVTCTVVLHLYSLLSSFLFLVPCVVPSLLPPHLPIVPSAQTTCVVLLSLAARYSLSISLHTPTTEDIIMPEEIVTVTASTDLQQRRGLEDPQDGTTTDNSCQFVEGRNVCTALAKFNFGDDPRILKAAVDCPFDATSQSEFREASANGLCGCTATIRAETDSEDAAVPLNCTCLVCPSQENVFGVAYDCKTPITGPCLSFNCAGECNGDPNMNLIGNETRPPTAAPVAAPSSGFHVDPTMKTTALLILCMVRMFRH